MKVIEFASMLEIDFDIKEYLIKKKQKKKNYWTTNQNPKTQ